jgi:Mg2+/Co2+ transporter CorB
MVTRNKKKIDLLKMQDHERTQILREAKEQMRQKIAEAKMLQSLLDVESLTVNGNIVYRGDQQLNGFFLLK